MTTFLLKKQSLNNLKNIRDGKNRTHPDLCINEIYEYDIDSTPKELDEYCAKADFVLDLRSLVGFPKVKWGQSVRDCPLNYSLNKFGYPQPLGMLS